MTLTYRTTAELDAIIAKGKEDEGVVTKEGITCTTCVVKANNWTRYYSWDELLAHYKESHP